MTPHPPSVCCYDPFANRGQALCLDRGSKLGAQLRVKGGFVAEILRNLRIFDCKRKTTNMKLQLIHLFSSVFFSPGVRKM